MKKIILFYWLILASSAFAQNSVNAINVSAVSGNTYSHSIGDIYVVPIGTTPSNAGTMGVLSGFASQLVAVDNASYQGKQAYFYPNPVANILYLGIKTEENTKLNATVFDALGKNILTQTVSNGQLDMSSLSAGTYFIQLTNATENIAFKIIKN